MATGTDIIESLRRLIMGKLTDLSPVISLCCALIRQDIDKNFFNHGRWDGRGNNILAGGSQHWAPLAASTKSQYKRLGYELEPTLLRQRNLYAAIEVFPAGKNRIGISANTPYSRIHQLGGVIRHPGGTPYILSFNPTLGRVWSRFITKRKASQIAASRKSKYRNAVRYTKAHLIRILARPYITLTPEDIRELVNMLARYITSGK